MKNRKWVLWILLGVLLCSCFAFSAMAESEELVGMVEVEEGVFHGIEGGSVSRGIFHTVYPELSDFRIEEAGQTLTVGDTVHIHVKAIVADTDISNAYLYFGWNRNHNQYISLKLDQETGEYVGEYTFGQKDRDGEYYVTSAYIQDNYGFSTRYSSGSKRVMKRLFPASVNFRSDKHDQPFTNIVFEEAGKTLSPGDTLHMSFDLPKGLELDRIDIHFYTVSGGNSLYLYYIKGGPIDIECAYDAATGIFTCEYTLNETNYNGTYYLSSIRVYDSDQIEYRTSLSSSEGFKFVLKDARESAGTAVPDSPDNPDETDDYISIGSITSESDGKTLVDGDSVQVRYKIDTNGTVENTSVVMRYFDAYNHSAGSGVSTSISHYIYASAEPVQGEDGLYQVIYSLKEDDLYGVYTIEINADVTFSTKTVNGTLTHTESKTASTDMMFQFDEDAAISLNRLAPATDLNWTEDGYMRFTMPKDHQGKVYVRLHRIGQDISSWIRGITWRNMGEYTDWTKETGVNQIEDWEDPENGTYYFSVVILGDGKNYFDSPAAISGPFTYIKPEKQLKVPGKPVWNAETKMLETQIEAQEGEKYTIDWAWSYSEGPNDTPESCWWSSSGTGYGPTAATSILDGLLQEFGSGYYCASARRISDNVFESLSSDWSEISDGLYFGASEPEEGEESIIEKLENVITDDKTADEIREQVQEIDRDDLTTALLTDEDTANLLRNLEIAANAETVVVATENAPGIAEGVTTVGAGLNNLTGDEAPRLIIDKPKQEDVLPTQYVNAMSVRFSLELENVENPENLKVPVLIDMPIPSYIVPAYVVILHYHLTTNEPERIRPYVYQAGNKWYAQFALTSFSDFIMTCALQEMDGDLLRIPSDVKVIEEETFRAIAAKIIIIPEGCTRIGARAFSNCRELVSVYIPESVKEIAENAFEGCTDFIIISNNEVIKSMPAYAGLVVSP